MKQIKSLFVFVLTIYMVLNPMSVYALTKNETVYTSLDEQGKLVISSVTNHLLVNDEAELEDETELKNLLNINGKETYTWNQNKLRWNSFGRDIFYRGETEKEQPIEVQIEYYLDGKKMKAKEMVGKKGNVKIEFHYQNRLQHEVNIEGKKEIIYTPFVVTTGMVISNENNRNIQVQNGKSVDTGTRTMIVGLSTPGLYESLDVEQLKQLNTVTVTFDTTHFKLGNTYIVATPKLLEEQDFSIFEKMDQLSSNIEVLKKSMDRIEAGTIKLEQGSHSLSLGASDISTNLKIVLDSVTKLKNGSIHLTTGINELSTTLKESLSDIEMKDIESSILGLQQLKSANENTAFIIMQQTVIQLQMLGLVSVIDINDANELYQILTDFYNANIKGIEDSNLNSQLLSVKSSYELVNLLLLNGNTMNDIKTSLTEIQTIKEMIPTLNGVLDQITLGSSTISNGLITLEAGAKQLSNGSDQLTSGSRELETGVITLHQAISKVNQEGIMPLYSYSNIIHRYSSKLEAMKKKSLEYHGFGSNNVDQTLFIYKIASIK